MCTSPSSDTLSESRIIIAPLSTSDETERPFRSSRRR
jgi:hypothetical protein